MFFVNISLFLLRKIFTLFYCMYTSGEFTSSLLTGSAWDRTLGWLEETGAVSSFEIVGDSKTWGNYSDDEFGKKSYI